MIRLVSRYTLRPDIEGLRALAVGAVIASHVSSSVLRGGFCGVDVFFVISGFLIGKHLLEDIQAGEFSFLRFYARRARRILPALVTVLLAVWALGWLILSGPEFAALGRHVAAAAVFANNILLWSEVGYFDAAATTKPLLHLWSLGIEEQFYLLVPVLLWLGARGRQASVRWVVRLSVLSLLIMSLRGVASFYLLDTRFWELGAGVVTGHLALRATALRDGTLELRPAAYREILLCCLALLFAAVLLASQREPWSESLLLKRSGLAALLLLACAAAMLSGAYLRAGSWRRLMAICARHDTALRTALAAAGLALVAASFLVMTPTDWPGLQTLFPVLGTALIIAAGPATGVNRLLGTRPLVFLGGISYPLYLWHWPAIVFWRMFAVGGAAAWAWVPVGAAVLLAWATRQWVENPVRFGRLGRSVVAAPPVWALSLALLVSALLGLSAVATGGFPGRLPPGLQAIAGWSARDGDVWRARRCYLLPQQTGSYAPECTPPPRAGIRQVALWGDSHAAQLYPGLLELQGRDEFDLAQWTAAGCPPTRVPLIEEFSNCAARRSEVLAALARTAPDTVLLAGAWEIYLEQGASAESILDSTLDSIRWLRAHGVRRIVLFGPGPTWNATLPADLFRYMSLRRTDRIPERLGGVARAVQRLDAAMASQAQAAHVPYVSLVSELCDARGCRTTARSGQVPPDLLFRDRDHLTTSGSRLLIEASACQIVACPQSP